MTATAFNISIMVSKTVDRECCKSSATLLCEMFSRSVGTSGEGRGGGTVQCEGVMGRGLWPTLVCGFGSSRRRQPMRTLRVCMMPADTKLVGLGSMPFSTERP